MENKIFSGLGECNICRNGSFGKVADKLRTGEDHKIYKCLHCGHIQLLPRPTPEEDKTYYDADSQEKAIRSDVNISALRRNSHADVKRRADFIADNFTKDKKILDIGCGYGYFLEEMRSRGYDIEGVEVSKDRRDIAVGLTGCNIFETNFIEDDNIDIGKYDIVTLFHVLEHVADPIGFVRNIRKVLKDGGCFIVEVPNVNELLLDTCPSYFDFYWIRAHLSYFDSHILSLVMEKSGFEHCDLLFVQRYGVENLVNWLTTGKPQYEKPAFDMIDVYSWLESCYRNKLIEMGKTDTLFCTSYLNAARS